MSLGPQEKKAIVGISATLLFVVVSLYEIGKRNFWFEAKNIYYTHFGNADGLRIGSAVTIAGLRVGEVSALDVDEQNRIAVTLTVRRAVASRLRSDSAASISGAYLIGEKRIDLRPGGEQARELSNGATLPGRDSTDLAEFLSGEKLTELMKQVEALIGGLSGAVKEINAVLGQYHSGTFDKAFTMVEPALRNFLQLSDDMLVMTKEMKTKSKQLPVFVESGAEVFRGLHDDFLANRLAKDSLEKMNRVLTPLADRQQLVTAVLDNLGDLSRDLKSDPRYGRQALDAVQELTITLKALQKTWLLEDQSAEATKEVKAQEHRQPSKPEPEPNAE